MCTKGFTRTGSTPPVYTNERSNRKNSCRRDSSSSPTLTRETFNAQPVRFIRRMGLHRPDTTPYGEVIPVSQAHVLTELEHAGSTSQSRTAEARRLEKSTNA